MRRLRNQVLIAGALIAGALLTGCSPQSDYGAYNPEPMFKVEDKFEYKRELETPQLDLVFIMDNSKSMHTHLTNLSQNIEKFLGQFNTENLDLRVGVVTVFDATRYREYASKEDPQRLEDARAYNEAYSEAARAFMGSHDNLSDMDLAFEMYLLSDEGPYRLDYRYAYFEDQGLLNTVLPVGVMRPVRTGPYAVDTGRSFLSNRDSDFVAALKDTLLVTSDFHREAAGKNQGWAALGAPVIEEVFSVVQGITDPQVNKQNQSFLRENSHLAVVIVTDAEDSSGLDPDTAARALLNFKGKSSKLSVYGVLSILSEGVGECETDAYVVAEGGIEPVRPRRIEEFIRKLNGSTYSLCSADFGSELATIGSDLVRKVFEQNDFELNHVPTSIYDIQVFVDNQPVDSWIYNNNRHSISLKAIAQPEAEVRVEYFTPNPAMLANDFVTVGGAREQDEGEPLSP